MEMTVHTALRRISFSSTRMIGRLRDCLHLRCDALAPHTETYQAGGQPAQNRKINKKPEEPRRLDFAGTAEDTGDYSFLYHDLARSQTPRCII
jgi:hypothetical protein